MKRDNAFTGLEAAIVLIAFVVVAAVFSYVMLGAGFFATQKAQEVTYASIKQATSNVVFDGFLYGNVTTDGNLVNRLDGIIFTVKVPSGGMAIDMNATEFIYTSTRTMPPLTAKLNSAKLYSDPIVYPGTSDKCASITRPNPPLFNVYYPSELQLGVETNAATSILHPGNSATYAFCLGEQIGAGEWFSLEMVPQIGAPTLITKSLDAGLAHGRPLL